ncbi:tail fiber assembly protein [Erwinia sp. PK3-005]
MDGQDAGKMIAPDADGRPILINRPAPTSEQLIGIANTEKEQRLNAATTTIAPLQDAVDLGMATDKGKESLEEWKKYRVLLNRVDTSTAPDIEWPVEPSSQAGK